MKEQRTKILEAYKNQSKVLFAYTDKGIYLTNDGKPCRAGNGFASFFWAGFDGMTKGVRIPTRAMISYDWYMAGRAARKEAK